MLPTHALPLTISNVFVFAAIGLSLSSTDTASDGKAEDSFSKTSNITLSIGNVSAREDMPSRLLRMTPDGSDSLTSSRSSLTILGLPHCRATSNTVMELPSRKGNVSVKKERISPVPQKQPQLLFYRRMFTWIS
mmetsp:Transcript_11026/g.23573  ORF Transcript_11026/g.23573 Transcript_11026/m.23573 type:complete len:134 (-) Transcript_11026:1104-1505(-)